jgi:hypothetical protein
VSAVAGVPREAGRRRPRVGSHRPVIALLHNRNMSEVTPSLTVLLQAEVSARFEQWNPQFADSDDGAAAAVVIECPSGAMGDVRIYADGELLLYVHGWTHGHFDDGDDSTMVEACCNFLDALFADRVVVYQAPGENGWFFPESPYANTPPAGARMARWSKTEPPT